jgi:hypothetical protein
VKNSADQCFGRVTYRFRFYPQNRSNPITQSGQEWHGNTQKTAVEVETAEEMGNIPSRNHLTFCISATFLIYFLVKSGLAL